VQVWVQEQVLLELALLGQVLVLLAQVLLELALLGQVLVLLAQVQAV
jgi:hypothetical protein